MSVLSGLSSRFEIFNYFFSKKEVRNRVGFGELLRHTFSPKCEYIAKKYAQLEKTTDKYRFYKINGYEKLFQYPVSAPYHNFAQVIAEGMLDKHWHHYEIEQTLVSKDDVIVDCGSAEGFFAFKYQDIAKKIYCVEPLPLFVDSLTNMFADNDRVEVLPYALGSASGTLYMELNGSAIASSCHTSPEGMGNHIVVKAFKIDDLFADKNIAINYLKADLEGFEEEMIKGALQTIKISRPKIAITTYHDGQDHLKLIELVRSVVPEYNYLVKGIENRVGNPVMLHMWI